MLALSFVFGFSELSNPTAKLFSKNLPWLEKKIVSHTHYLYRIIYICTFVHRTL